MDFAKIISQELNWNIQKIKNTLKLLDEGNTIPFIARYRKELTGEMDEIKLRQLEDRYQYLKSLLARKNEVSRLIFEAGLLTEELSVQLEKAQTLQQVEDLYRPFRPKRQTKASIAKELGLEPLAIMILKEELGGNLTEETIATFLNPEQGLDTGEKVLEGARDIIAEMIADDPEIRELTRKFFSQKGELLVSGESKETTPYEMYYAYQEPLRLIQPHRILAINRGEKEKVLQVKILVPEEELLKQILAKLIKYPQKRTAQEIEKAVIDGSKRLLFPSIQREIRNQLTIKAQERAIHVFAANLRKLLLQPPIRNEIVMGVDPGFRTGCKLAVVDQTGKLLEVGVIFPNPPQNKKEESQQEIKRLINKHKVTALALGNGTASRETETFLSEYIKEEGAALRYTIVNEAGASVYSASVLAAKEFPQLDLSYRSAVSIARRLQDPLAELVKIDPQSVGVGQYQHDVNENVLRKTLGDVVESCVNAVGVELNTASSELLQYVAGLSQSVAGAIVSRREKEGLFRSREELLEIPRLGPKVYQQCSGFLRIADGENPLDNTPVHPESYETTLILLNKFGLTLKDLKMKTQEIREAFAKISLPALAEQIGVGLFTLQDIVEALKRPGRDPREDLPPVVFRRDVLSFEDLHQGMVLEGTIRNVVDFGAFVDIGVKQDGLIHISELSEKYIKHPLEAVSLGDQVKVAVLDVDKERGRISLTMRGIN